MRRLGAFLVVASALATAWSGSGGVGATPTAVEDRAGVAFVGDSIGRDAEPEIRASVQATNEVDYYHAIGAGYTRYHLHADPDGDGPAPDFLATIRAEDGPNIVVAELGTGDAFWHHGASRFEVDMRQFLDAISNYVDCVIWIEQKPGGNRAYPQINERAEAFNRVVHRVVQDYGNATYLHYAAWTELAGSPSPYFLGDYLHLTQAGERELGRLVGNAVRGCDPDLTSGPFWDVQDDFWAADAINWAAAEGLVDGYDNDTYRAVIGQFRPAVTRGQAALMLWRLEGSPPETTPHGWSDGEPWLRSALRWGRAHRVLTGFPDNTFRPSLPVSRGALVVMLWKAVGRPGGFPAHPWVGEGLPARMNAALNWAAANGIVTGMDGDFDRSRPVDRAQIAVWLQATAAYLELPPPSPPPPVAPTTVPPTTLPAVPPPTTVVPTTVPPTTITP